MYIFSHSDSTNTYTSPEQLTLNSHTRIKILHSFSSSFFPSFTLVNFPLLTFQNSETVVVVVFFFKNDKLNFFNYGVSLSLGRMSKCVDFDVKYKSTFSYREDLTSILTDSYLHSGGSL